MFVVECAGGVDRYLYSFLKYFNREKYESVLVCSFNYDISKYKDLVDYVEQIEMNHSIGVKDIKTTFEIRKTIQKYNPDIVYAHSSKAGALARIATINMRLISVYNPHGWAFNMRGHNVWIYKILEQIMSRFCNKIICISEAERESAIREKICPENKLVVIDNGIDTELYNEMPKGIIKREDLNIPNDAFLVGMVGRIAEQKAPDVFIKAARYILEKIPNAYFIMVGDGCLVEQILSYAKSYKIDDKIIITGWVDEPLSYMELFDVALLLSRWEGFGLVLPEYMISGKPIVATSVDAIPYIITDGENGLLVPVDDATAVAESVWTIYNDDYLRKRIVQKGITDVRNKYNVRRMVAEHEKVFDTFFD